MTTRIGDFAGSILAENFKRTGDAARAVLIEQARTRQEKYETELAQYRTKLKTEIDAAIFNLRETVLQAARQEKQEVLILTGIRNGDDYEQDNLTKPITYKNKDLEEFARHLESENLKVGFKFHSYLPSGSTSSGSINDLYVTIPLPQV